VQGAPIVLALDGERTLALPQPEAVQIRLSAAGPRVVEIRTAMKRAAQQGFFVQPAVEPASSAQKISDAPPR